MNDFHIPWKMENWTVKAQCPSIIIVTMYKTVLYTFAHETHSQQDHCQEYSYFTNEIYSEYDPYETSLTWCPLGSSLAAFWAAFLVNIWLCRRCSCKGVKGVVGILAP